MSCLHFVKICLHILYRMLDELYVQLVMSCLHLVHELYQIPILVYIDVIYSWITYGNISSPTYYDIRARVLALVFVKSIFSDHISFQPTSSRSGISFQSTSSRSSIISRLDILGHLPSIISIHGITTSISISSLWHMDKRGQFNFPARGQQIRGSSSHSAHYMLVL